MLIEPSPTPTRGALHAQQRGWAASPAGCEGSRAQPSLVLVGMLGHRGWSWTVVADDGVPITVRPAEVHVLLRNLQVELVPCRRVRVRVGVGRSSETVEGGTRT